MSAESADMHGDGSGRFYELIDDRTLHAMMNT